MQRTIDRVNKLITAGASIISAVLLLGAASQVGAGEPAQKPVFLSGQVQPLLMLNMSKDHQLYFRLYDDYADITDSNGLSIPDGNADITYVHAYNYFGYFDSNRCYTYNGDPKNVTVTARFEPSTVASKDCTGMWSGNFLNWATMTRIDAIRKILYGGRRVVDSTTETVLERSYLPNDTHSFAKFYKGPDLSKVVPKSLVSASGITLCNTTDTTATYSQNATEPPLIKVAIGDYSLWANNERWQCKWLDQANGSNEQKNASNGNIQVKDSNGKLSYPSGLTAKAGNPSSGDVGNGTYVARVQTCVKDLTGDDEGCAAYGVTAKKPVGLLQEYGNTKYGTDKNGAVVTTNVKEKASILFGLMTGSYDTSKSGGVLRKAIGTLDDEINAATGEFVKPAPTANSIINTLNLLKIYGYDATPTSGLYMGGPSTINKTSDWYYEPKFITGSDNCGWIGSNGFENPANNYPRAFFDNDRCSNWGNPQAEIYLESLRYLAGAAKPNPTFAANDSAYITGLNSVATWSDPINTNLDGNYCAPLNVLMFNASVTSYDADELSPTATNPDPLNFLKAIGINDLAALSATTDIVGNAEGIIKGSNFFVGNSPSSNDELCTAKDVGSLSKISGICPEAPRLEGGYQIAGLAYHARSKGIKSQVIAEVNQVRRVKTFAVAMAPATPKVTVTAPDGSAFTIIPACRNTSTYKTRGITKTASSCAIVDFKIVSQTATTGTLYVDWEDMEQGSDFDQDMWGTIKYVINPTAKTVTITTYVAADSTGNSMGFGYVLSGTKDPGFKVFSGIHNFVYDGVGSGCTKSSPCNTANSDATVQTKTYEIGSSILGKSLDDPLKYAAKWGGYSDDSATPESIAASTPTNYFFATDPRKLKASMRIALDNISKADQASATAASSSTRLDSDTLVYQAVFSSTDWSGEISAYSIATGSTAGDPKWSTDNTLIKGSLRNIYTYDAGKLVTLSSKDTTPVVAFTSLSTGANGLRASLKVSGELDETNATKRYNWLLGSAADEMSTDATGAVKPGALRARTKLLGDVVNSTPALAGKDTQHYEELPTAYGSASYSDYVTKGAKSTRIPVLYVGANDGMLHAFNATSDKLKGGDEIFAYIPRGAYKKLAGLSAAASFEHQYIVDGPITVGDAYVKLGNEGQRTWHTIMVGSQGAGGKGVFALDVTIPTSPKVIFDYSDTDSGSYSSDLGFNYGKTFIVPTADGKWRVIFGNGGNSTNGYAKMIAIDIEDPSAPIIIDTKAKMGTGTGNDNGLSGVSLVPDGDGIYTYAYAGDLMGNMWKFDLTGASSNWKVAYGTASAPVPLITVIDPAGTAQPITAAPTIGKNAVKLTSSAPLVPSNMVYFGTGKLIESGDKTATQIQTLYGIADSGTFIPAFDKSDRAKVLHQKTIASETGGLNDGKRTIANDKTTDSGLAVDWNGVKGTVKRGWFLDLQFGSTATGERIIAKPLLLYDRVIINTFIPSPYQCGFGGSGWLMELTGVGDKFIGYDLLGDNGNHILDNVILGNLIAIFDTKKVDIVGSGLKPGNDEKGSIKGFLKDKPSSAYGRMSWRQLK